MKKKALGDMVKYLEMEDEFEQAKSNAWLATFTDLLALMISFFILIYASSTTNDAKWDSLYDSVKVHFRPLADAHSNRKTLDLEYVEQLLQSNLKGLKGFEIFNFEDELVIKIDTERFFTAQTFNLSQSGHRLLRVLASTFNNINNSLRIRMFYNENLSAVTHNSLNNMINFEKGLLTLIQRTVFLQKTFQEKGYIHKIPLETNFKTVSEKITDDFVKSKNHFLSDIEIVVTDQNAFKMGVN